MPRRLIEEAFPLQKVSEDSKHEKNVRHGHISTLHIWPARRPLAACRAVTIATLLPDPADAPEKIKAEYTRLSGSPLPEKQREYLCNDLIASLTRWGDENGHADWNAKDKNDRWLNKLHIARDLILMAYDGHPPKVMDMFAGGGAIPLEAMRLGCEVTASDYNPVAWFLLKCSLEYPQRLAGKTAKLPDLNLDEKPNLREGDLADHVRLWGQWVLESARKELVQYYPVVDNKPTVAYLWARTIPCQDPQCGATIPLLKTLWVCKKAEKTLPDTPENRERPDFLRLKETKNQTKVIINGKRALKLCPDPKTKRVRFEIIAPKNADDVGKPTKSGSGAICPFPDCGSQQPDDYIKQCGHEGKLKAQMTAVVYQEEYGKEYRSPAQEEIDKAEVSTEELGAIADQIPHGVPEEAMPGPQTLGFSIPLYGFKKWSDVFSTRQLLALMTFVKWTRTAQDDMARLGYSVEWIESVVAYLGILINRLSNYASTACIWEQNAEEVKQTFLRFAFPIIWDFAEGNPLFDSNRYYRGAIDSVGRFLEKTLAGLCSDFPRPKVVISSAQQGLEGEVDAIITDPPYYDAIPYAHLSDFFYVWLRRSIGDGYPDAFTEPLTPKPAELVQHSERFDGDKKAAKAFYEDGMAESFRAAYQSLSTDGLIVIVFAHKNPDAWETLTKAMIQSGLVITASWPIDTELQGGLKLNRAALATSLWMVCRKRPIKARVGHYGKVKRGMQDRITERLRYFWDEGVRGPDFVWSAIGPALESYSSYKEVRRSTGEPFTVTEFLTEVRRIVTDFALGQILHGTSTEALDEWTRYYLMHKDYFGTENAPVGECILLAQGYGVLLDDLRAAQTGFLKKVSSGSALKLLGHTERTSDRVGYAHTSGRIPMIDMIHRIMKLWDKSDSAHIDAYFHEHGLQENPLFKAVVQALIETSPQGASERSLLETLINYEPGEVVSGVSFPRQAANETEQQLTFNDIS
ncbi:DUF1156 domain-containing protein [Candidatus Poribacteria bacterium]|nr:DUF1156 domain-containing protein [Candidatus Poribacteria bacterium]